MKKFTIVIAGILATQSMLAQELNLNFKSLMSFNYSVAVPVGNLGDFISKTSPRGFSFEYKKALTPNFYIGGETGFNNFYEDLGNGTFEKGTASITGYQTRYNTSLPFLVTADYFYQENDKFKPYLSLGIGTIYDNREVDLGLLTDSADAWFFAIKPEVGVLFNINSFSGIKIGAKYYQTFDARDLDAYSYFSFNIGYVLMRF